MTPRGRFAPSPTGELHLGNARTALLAWLQVRALGGRFVVRVEDLDRAREIPGATERQLAALRALGLDWDEGPDVGGPWGPYLQSQRLALYEDAIARLTAQGLAYPCYCSRAEVARAARAPHGPGDDGPRYPGTCRHLTESERRARDASGRRPALRFRAREGRVGFEDGVMGRFEQDVQEEIGDFVIRRADGVHAYQLAVVVDDAAMGMTHVLRGADLLGSTPRQLLLHEALGATPPRFFHVPLVLGPDGGKLSKSQAPASVSALRGAGSSARSILATLARISGLDLGEGKGARDLVDRFHLGAVPRGNATWPGA